MDDEGRYTCDVCGKSYTKRNNLTRHKTSAHNQFESKDYSCTICSFRTNRSDQLLRHYRLYHKPHELGQRKRISGDSEEPGPSKTPRPGETDGVLPQISDYNLPSTSGIQDTARPPTPPTDVSRNSPENRQRQGEGAEAASGLEGGLEQEADDSDYESEGEPDNRIVALIAQNERHIRTSKSTTRRVQDRYNFELIDVQPKQLEAHLRQIYSEQGHPFLLNAAFGFVLADSITGEPIYYYASLNNRILDRPMMIRRYEDIRRFMERFNGLDVLEYCRQQRPNSKYIVKMVTNILFYVDKQLAYHITGGIELPNFIDSRRCVIGQNKNREGQLYTDNYCIFRCYAYHKLSNARVRPEVLDTYIKPYCRARRINSRKFPGIKMDNLQCFEDFFGVNIEVFTIEQYVCEESQTVKTRAQRIRISRGKYDDTMNLNVYRNHFSYITDLDVYTNCWQCRKCRKLFNNKYWMEMHERTCNVTTEIVHPGGGYGAPKSVFELLKENSIEVDKELQFYPYRISWDCEALAVPYEDDRGKKETILGEQQPASVSTCSNVPGFTCADCIVSDGDPSRLVSLMYARMKAISMAAYDIQCQKFEHVINEIEFYKHEREYLLEQAQTAEQNGDKTQAEAYLNEAYPLKVYCGLSAKLESWLSQIPVLGFNCGKYDFNLIRRYLFPFFIENGVEVNNIIKKDNDYLSITTENFLFLDIKNYVAAGTSYAKWLAANDIVQRKGIFPYSWLTDLKKLNQAFLPPIEEFWSELRQRHVDPDDYAYLQRIWIENKFKNMRQLLIWYNNLDVVPFLEAAEKMFQMWKGLEIDCFKSGAISLPGLALSYLTRTMQRHTILPLFDEKNKDIYQTIRDNVVGGLSIVMHRYHEVDKTTLPNGKKCGWIYSHDCNALYLWCLGEPTGTGLHATWRPKNQQSESTEGKKGWPELRRLWEASGNEAEKLEWKVAWENIVIGNMKIPFTRKQAYPYARTELNWLEWVAHSKDCQIEHRFNGRPKTVFISKDVYYRVDGYDRESNTVYQMHGCHWHGHGCKLDNEKDARKRQVKRDQTVQCTTDIRDKGFNVEEMWECEWHELRKRNPAIDRFLDENLNLQVKENHLSAAQILDKIKAGKLFGMIQCDIEIPWWDDKAIERFEEFPPICKNVLLSRDDLGANMREHAIEGGYMQKPTKSLINSFFGENILLTTPILLWYIQNGLQITQVKQVIEMKPKQCFAQIRDSIADHRRRADLNPAYKTMGEYWKTIGNSCYGKTMTRKERHKETVLTDNTGAAKLVNDKRFNKMEEVGLTAYEVCRDKKKIKMDLPLTVAFFVYNYAKLKMLSFIYDFLKRYLRAGSFQMVCSDTDSILAAYESKNLDELVRPELKVEYDAIGKPAFLATDSYSKRTPGLFKEDWSGGGVTALCSKTYFTWSEEEKKISSKGVSKQTNDFSKADYDRVLKKKKKGSGTNYGFKVARDRLLLYRQKRDGLTYLYAKRQVMDDKVSTKALYR